ncbi:MAG TPA: UvrD-helicase domain-containing protein [Candidatus Methylacidiphilales bacterium]|nr:UvrD-helicase domain-containing protein [Candidatus Methylacidiphilales bacterium]
MNNLTDQMERDRFVYESGKNISVIAPAGVGKTRSIVDRIVYLAKFPEARAIEQLSRLVVVTYSVRAAQQMQQRARAALRRERISPQVYRAFQQTFFGTIHSYCVRLLDRFGHYLGLPSSAELLQNDAEMWERFLVRGFGREIIASGNLDDLFHFYSPEKLYALGKTVSPGLEIAVGPLPVPDLKRLLDYSGAELHANTRKGVAAAQTAAKHWSEAWARGDRFHALPKAPGGNASDFIALWEAVFAPLHEWLRGAALAFGRKIANAYEEFRLSEGIMTYDDQVRLALRLLENRSVRCELAADDLSVLLDEAQDTDPLQFEVLLRVAGLRGERPQAAEQSFCIVGDFQQAIYAPRSDLAAYRRIHEEISSGPRGAQSRLQVTFRCDRAIIDFVNRLFPALLHGENGQSPFVELVAHGEAGAGQVIRWNCPGPPEDRAGKKLKMEDCAKIEAKFLAGKIARTGLGGFGAGRWSDIAILCPRRNWLVELQSELHNAGLPVQVHSSDEKQGDRTARAWLTALIWVTAHPEDEFEIAGVLREVFGVSDHDMALFTGGDGSRLQLVHPVRDQGDAMTSALKILHEIAGRAEGRPLHAIIRELVECSRLRERLFSLHEDAGEDQRELDDFLALIFARCAERVTLSDLAEELRSSLDQTAQTEEETHDAIQLLTSHKAKGLEWPVVILPFIFRPIGAKNSAYPRLVRGHKEEEIICRDKADFTAMAKAFVNQRERQQLQRLLYVMVTRAKNSLLLLDDEALFVGTKRSEMGTLGELLGLSKEVLWKSLPENFEVQEAARPMETVGGPEFFMPVRLTKSHLRQAIERAEMIPRRITPHALAGPLPLGSEPETQTEQEDYLSTGVAKNPGIRYGIWWHEFVATVPWREARPAWSKRFDEAVAWSPQPGRSRREWELFLSSPLADWLATPNRLIQIEIPFLWNEEENRCIEGVMDLAVFASDESAWRVIDWKTNYIGPEGSNELAEGFRGQIRAYVHALRKMLSAEVRGSLYFTQSGEWIETG